MSYPMIETACRMTIRRVWGWSVHVRNPYLEGPAPGGSVRTVPKGYGPKHVHGGSVHKQARTYAT